MKILFYINTSVLLVLALSACGSDLKPYSPERKKKYYGMTYRQLAPEPVYNRLAWVYLPEPLPSKEMPGVAAPAISPVVHLELKDVSIEEAAEMLASTARYKSLVDASLTGRRVSFNSLGTIDELARQFAKSEKISVDVDHPARLVRFSAGSSLAPALYQDNQVLGGSENEHKSNN